MEKQYLTQLFEENRIAEFQTELGKQIAFYRINVIVYDISNVGTLLLLDVAGNVCAEFKLSNFDCKRSPSPYWVKKEHRDTLVNDEEICDAYLKTMNKMFPDYKRAYIHEMDRRVEKAIDDKVSQSI